MSTPRRRLLAVAPVAALLLLLGGLYLPGFSGYWLGDDYSNLHNAYVWSVKGTVDEQLWRQFSASTSEGAAFFRPLIIASLTVDFLRAGTDYGSWYLYNVVIHMANCILLVVVLRRLGRHADVEVGVAAPLAAALFGLSPLLAEGVFWLSARSDASVTLFCLSGLFLWLGPGIGQRARVGWLPVLLLPALLFKESAALLPLQAGMLWLAVPTLRDRRRLLSLLAAAALVGLFLAWRAYLFGDPWQVYGGARPDEPDLLTRGIRAAGSVAPWLQGLSGERATLLVPYLGLLLVAGLLGAVVGRARVAALALFAASGGAVLATLLNLGTLGSNGEGGRLFYTPLAWLALGMGLLVSARTVDGDAGATRLRQASVCGLLLATAFGALITQSVLQRVWVVQHALQTTAAALPRLAEAPGALLLLLPDHVGPVVAARNGQAAFVLRPLQPEGLIDRILPTLPQEVASRHGQYAEGLLDRLDAAQLQYFDPDVLGTELADPQPRWPSRIACWSTLRGEVIEFPAPPADDAAAWAAGILDSARQQACLLH